MNQLRRSDDFTRINAMPCQFEMVLEISKKLGFASIIRANDNEDVIFGQ
jgi:hypothetical protein